MTFFFMDLLLVAAAFVSVLRGFWALRRRALPTRAIRLTRSPEPGGRDGLRLVASSEEASGRRAVTIACVGTTEELECLLRTLERRATLHLVHENEDSVSGSDGS